MRAEEVKAQIAMWPHSLWRLLSLHTAGVMAGNGVETPGQGPACSHNTY